MGKRLDREAVARILDRAQQLDDTRSGPGDEGIEPATLVEAAAEVGIDPNAVRDSLALELLSIEPVDIGALDRLAGPGVVIVEREVSLTVGQVMTGLDEWLSSVHRMTCDRRSATTLFARRRTDSTAVLGRRIAGTRGEGRLGSVGELTAEAVAQTLGSTPTRPRTIVRISADRNTPRHVRLGGGGAVGVVGVGAGVGVVAVGGATAAVAAAVPFVSLPLIVGGYAIARTGRGHADRLELELERLLSSVERGDRPSGLLDKVARRARRAAKQSRT